VLSDVLAINRIFKPKSFDTVVALELIEHFDKHRDPLLLNSMERIAKRKVILTTPNRFHPQKAYDNNPYQEHRSGWTVRELERLGYRCFGLSGFNFLYNHHEDVLKRGLNHWCIPLFFWWRVKRWSTLVVHHLPHLAYRLLAVKNL
jgi:hypothetical protein